MHSPPPSDATMDVRPEHGGNSNWPTKAGRRTATTGIRASVSDGSGIAVTGKARSRLGYSIGIGFPPTWGERTASLRSNETTVLEPGMAFHMMPGLWLKGTGVTITQSFVVTKTGSETLTSSKRELIVKQ